jgi:hypothetical protein
MLPSLVRAAKPTAGRCSFAPAAGSRPAGSAADRARAATHSPRPSFGRSPSRLVLSGGSASYHLAAPPAAASAIIRRGPMRLRLTENGTGTTERWPRWTACPICPHRTVGRKANETSRNGQRLLAPQGRNEGIGPKNLVRGGGTWRPPFRSLHGLISAANRRSVVARFRTPGRTAACNRASALVSPIGPVYYARHQCLHQTKRVSKRFSTAFAKAF